MRRPVEAQRRTPHSIRTLLSDRTSQDSDLAWRLLEVLRTLQRQAPTLLVVGSQGQQALAPSAAAAVQRKPAPLRLTLGSSPPHSTILRRA
jgi:hypothetical protein